MRIDAKTLTKNLSGMVHLMACILLELDVYFTKCKVHESFVEIQISSFIRFFHTNTIYSIFLTTISPLTS